MILAFHFRLSLYVTFTIALYIYFYIMRSNSGNSEATAYDRHPQLQMFCMPLINGGRDAQKVGTFPSYVSFPHSHLFLIRIG